MFWGHPNMKWPPQLLCLCTEATERPAVTCGFPLSLHSPEEPVHDPERVHHVHAVAGERRVQPRPRPGHPGHEPPADGLLHLLLAQHLPVQGPGDGHQQHRALHQVRSATSGTESYVSYRELRQVLRARTGTECYIRYRALRQVRRATSGTESYVRYGELCQVQRARSGTES